MVVRNWERCARVFTLDVTEGVRFQVLVMVKMQGALSSITIGSERPVLGVGVGREVELHLNFDNFASKHLNWLEWEVSVVPCPVSIESANDETVLLCLFLDLTLVRDAAIVPGVGGNVNSLSNICFQSHSVSGTFSTADSVPDAGVLLLRVVIELQEFG